MQRNLDEEKIVDKMRSLRDKRDLEILNQELEGINLNCDYQKKIEDNKVLDVKYLGIIDFENKDTNIYLLFLLLPLLFPHSLMLPLHRHPAEAPKSRLMLLYVFHCLLLRV